MRILDLFCGAGGAAMGYHRAGFEVEGVDLTFQPRYPFKFWHGDALSVLEDEKFVARFDAIHASPPCQLYSTTNSVWKRDHPDLVAPVRELLIATGLPYVIENVPGAPLRSPALVCGSGLGMVRIRRHRLFESNVFLWSTPCAHGQNNDTLSVTGHSEDGNRSGPGYLKVDREEAMGTDWMTMKELTQSIPPAYTQFIGEQLLAHLEANALGPSSERRSWMEDEVAHERMTGQHEDEAVLDLLPSTRTGAP